MPAPRKPKPCSGSSLADALKPRLAADKARTKARMAELRGAPAPLKQEPVASFLAAVMDCSPFLRALILDDPDRLAAILASDPAVRLKEVTRATAAAWRETTEPALMATLRRARQEMALTTALADLGGVWDVNAVTAALTEFADAAVGAAVRFLVAQAAAAGEIAPADPEKPDAASGWIILGMGKFGAGELNYSSDIDLIVLFDRERIRLRGDREPATFFVKLTKRLVAILSERTADGFVFRTDLRLRPDPGSTSIAISTEAALQYYESLGQNWERAALIKARPVAGDLAAGDVFLAALTPYIWRKYLDYAAISDIHSIKRQIHDHRGHAEVAVAGHNIKLGRGGIREIEFFVQTQQLIAGGRDPALRGRGTLDMLAALAAGGWIDEATRAGMHAAYLSLREIEHCLQMVADEQTHTLPEDDEHLAVIARMAGYANVAAFGKALTATLTTVRDRYTELFETAPSLTAKGNSLVFTGDADDPETLATLRRAGYRHPEEVTKAVRAWHFGRYPATRSASARERLTEFVPALIEALATTENADAAFAAFDRFLARMPAGVQLFALLQSNKGLLSLLAVILGTAPRLAETVIQRAHVLDALIEPAFFGSLPPKSTLERRLAATLAEARSFEDLLDRARIFGQEQSFLIGVRVLAGTVGVRSAGYAYSDLADTLLAALLDAVRREFEGAHGKMKGSAVALVAMGRLGGREMTAASDLDLLVLYDFDDSATASSGKRPLPGAQYFARLTQRVVAALSAPTAEGTLYPVDFRLRPSGNSGPLATHIDGFANYQANDAWTWEHMALTRARPIAGDAPMLERAHAEIARVLRRPHDGKKVISDVLEMRAMVEEAKGGEGIWDLKQTPGGLVDIEFVAQALQLIHGATHPALIATETETVLIAAEKAGVLPANEADVLLSALHLYQALIQILRLCVDGIFSPAEAPRGLLERLARAGELPDFATLEAHVRETEMAVRAAFVRVIGKAPAGKVAR
ncbi:MAG TPA: bifunctional [glutamine synthetase] adenylyltransferase/[glutamine synthetase]-adenylyl-L-tyrosine phosphorylase [Bauldia sp.]